MTIRVAGASSEPIRVASSSRKWLGRATMGE